MNQPLTPSPRPAHSPQALRVLALAVLLTVSACGGGGGDAASPAPNPPPTPTPTPTPAPSPTPSPTPTPSPAPAAAAKVAWNVNTAVTFTLEASGTPVSGPLTCSSQAPQALEVAADCSRVKGLRLGVHAVTVSGGGVSATTQVKVTPPPQPVSTYNTSTIAPGTLAVTPDGRLLAWGGYTSWHGGLPGFNAGLPLPFHVGTLGGGRHLTGLVAAAHGPDVTLALSEDGQVYSWGAYQTLGRPPNTHDYFAAGEVTPGIVADASGPLRNIVAVSTAANGALALDQDGSVYAWGPYSTAILPNPDNKVPQRLTLPAKAVALSSGQNWAAILLANGRVMTLRSGPGADGTYNFIGRPPVPGAVGLNVGYVIDNRTQQPLEGIIQVAVGSGHGLALTRDGQVLGWGDNNHGQVGQGHGEYTQVTGALPVLGPGDSPQLSDIVMVAAGHVHSLALDRTGRVYSWGLGWTGELGDGPGQPRVANPVRSYRPELVLDAAGTAPLSGAIAIYASTDTSMALMADAKLLTWGLRSELGQGAAAAALPQYQGLPVPVRDEGGTAPLLMTPLSHWPDLLRRGAGAGF